MDKCRDLLEWLGPDTSTIVFELIHDPADLMRVSAVSRSWRRFVVASGFSKRLCLRICPEVARFTRIETSESSIYTEPSSSTAAEWRSLEKEHTVYAFLGHLYISPSAERECIIQAICASSTDNFPDESIFNTLDYYDLMENRLSYWSSGGQMDSGVPESLTYKLTANLCLVNEIKIQPFKAYFQHGHPIYSAKSVRFRMGHFRLTQGREYEGSIPLLAADKNYKWTYISPEFPMTQDNLLQSFKLPEPVLCIGGILRVELLGRVQKQEVDNLYYICVARVHAIGSPLSPVFDVDMSDAPDNYVLKYCPYAREGLLPEASEKNDDKYPSVWNYFIAERPRHLRTDRVRNRAISAMLRSIHFSDDEDYEDDLSE